MLCYWWKHYPGWQAIAPENLPKVGFVIEGEEDPICAGFLYQTDSAVCWLEWIVTNPKIKAREKYDAISYLIDVICDEARGLGFKVIYTSSNQSGLMKLLKRKDILPTDTGVTMFFGGL
jgi:hypothetical protein